MPQMDSSKSSQDEDKITSAFEDTLLEKSNIILLGPTGCGMNLIQFLTNIFKINYDNTLYTWCL